MIRHALAGALAASALISTASAQMFFPNDFEPGSPMLDPVSSYFGGVASFGVRPSTQALFSGRSLELWANFQPDVFFNIAGFQVGGLSIPRANLGFAASASTFSVTVKPPATGRLNMIVSIREDDDGDGVLDSEADDFWESAPILLSTATQVYNIPLSTFTISNPGSGNGVRETGTSPRLGIVLTFETRPTLPGGTVEFPVALQIDHLGIYAGNQTLPTPPACPADLDNDGSLSNGGTQDGAVDINDLLFFLAAFEGGALQGDLDNDGDPVLGTPDGAVTIDDLLFFLARFEGGC